MRIMMSVGHSGLTRTVLVARRGSCNGRSNSMPRRFLGTSAAPSPPLPSLSFASGVAWVQVAVPRRLPSFGVACVRVPRRRTRG